MTAEKIRVLVADDNELFREGLISLLSESESITVVGQARDGCQAFDKVGILRPHVILMDLSMPCMDGVEATLKIKEQYPNVNIAILTVSEEEEDLFSAIRSGACSYLIKSIALEDLEAAIQTTAVGGAVVTPHLARKLLEEFSKLAKEPKAGPKETEHLTVREREVLELVAKGASNKEIAARLVIAESTAKVHLRNILEKLQLRNRQQAAALAVQEGVVTDIREDESTDDAP